ncbi:hypothetical protein ACEWPM_001120 [Roseovarius sp. S4756]|uniref:hypothetical protein n=1 Tax=Roseovarius maritimus TaxID=3342637 RepID=UPI003728DFD9
MKRILVTAACLFVPSFGFAQIACTPSDMFTVDKNGKPYTPLVASMFVDQTFEVDEVTGEHNLLGIGNSQSFDTTRILSSGAGASGTTILSTGNPGKDSSGAEIEEVQFFSIAPAGDGPRPFVFTEGSSFVMTGTCQ